MSKKQENLTTAQRLKQHLDKHAKDYYAPIREETKRILEKRGNKKTGN